MVDAADMVVLVPVPADMAVLDPVPVADMVVSVLVPVAETAVSDPVREVEMVVWDPELWSKGLVNLTFLLTFNCLLICLFTI